MYVQPKKRMSWIRFLGLILFLITSEAWANNKLKPPSNTEGQACPTISNTEGLISHKTNACILAVAKGEAQSDYVTSSDTYTLKISNYLPVAMNAYLVNADGSWLRLESSWSSQSKLDEDIKSGKNEYDSGSAISPRFLDITDNPDFSYHKNSYFRINSKNLYLVLTDLVNGGLVAVYYLYDSEDNNSSGKIPDAGCSCMVEANKSTVTVLVNEGILAIPNSIDGPPSFSKESPVPGDTMPILVGASYLGQYSVKSKKDADYKDRKDEMTKLELSAYDSDVDRVLTRHQYWSQTSNSLVVPAGEYVSFTTQTFYGTEDESSSSKQFSASLGLSASAGYGPISASISASLSASSNYAHNITVQTSTTETTIRTIDNTKKGDNDEKCDHIVQYFQLTDTITISGWEDDLNAMLANAVIIQKNSPALPARKGKEPEDSCSNGQ